MPKRKHTSPAVPEDFAAARAAAQDYTDVVLRFPNVVACGVGRRITGGRQTDEWCLVTCVSQKLPLTMMRADEVIPRELTTAEGTVGTDVVERELPELLVDAEMYRPLLGGCQISSQSGRGTLGAVVYDAIDYQPVLLTCNHCLTVAGSRSVIPGNAQIRQPAVVWSPPTALGASGVPTSGPVVGSTKRIVPWLPRPLGQTERAYGLQAAVDAGIVSLDQNIDADFRVIDLGRHPYVILPPHPELEVVKRGYRTEQTSGTVVEIDYTTYIKDDNGEIARIGGVDSGFTIKGPEGQLFSRRGDSGSLVVDADLAAARGLVFGGSAKTGITNACELGAIFEMLQLETPCMGGLHSMVRRAVFRRYFNVGTTVESGRQGLLGEMIGKTDRFRDRYLSDVPDGHVSGAFGHMLQTLATDLAYQVYADEDFAGLLDEAFGDWLVQPTVYDMLEYRLPENFPDRVLKAFGRLRERCPDAKGFEWLEPALASASGHTMREFLTREVPIDRREQSQARKRRPKRRAPDRTR